MSKILTYNNKAILLPNSKAIEGVTKSYWQQRPKDFLNMDEVIDDTDGVTYVALNVTEEMRTSAAPTRLQMLGCTSVTIYQKVNGAWVSSECTDPFIDYSSASFIRANYLPLGQQILKCKHKQTYTDAGNLLPEKDVGTVDAEMRELIAFGKAGYTYNCGSMSGVGSTCRHVGVYNAVFRDSCYVNGALSKANASYIDFHDCDFSRVTAVRFFQHLRAYCDCSAFNFSSACTTFSYAFDGLSAYANETLDFSNCDFSGATNTTGMFRNYGATTSQNFISTLKMGQTPAISFAINTMPELTHDCLVELIGKLPTVTTSQTLTLGSTLQAKLSAEEIAIAADKGWTVA